MNPLSLLLVCVVALHAVASAEMQLDCSETRTISLMEEVLESYSTQSWEALLGCSVRAYLRLCACAARDQSGGVDYRYLGAEEELRSSIEEALGPAHFLAQSMARVFPYLVLGVKQKCIESKHACQAPSLLQMCEKSWRRAVEKDLAVVPREWTQYHAGTTSVLQHAWVFVQGNVNGMFNWALVRQYRGDTRAARQAFEQVVVVEAERERSGGHKLLTQGALQNMDVTAAQEASSEDARYFRELLLAEHLQVLREENREQPQQSFFPSACEGEISLLSCSDPRLLHVRCSGLIHSAVVDTEDGVIAPYMVLSVSKGNKRVTEQLREFPPFDIVLSRAKDVVLSGKSLNLRHGCTLIACGQNRLRAKLIAADPVHALSRIDFAILLPPKQQANYYHALVEAGASLALLHLQRSAFEESEGGRSAKLLVVPASQNGVSFTYELLTLLAYGGMDWIPERVEWVSSEKHYDLGTAIWLDWQAERMPGKVPDQEEAVCADSDHCVLRDGSGDHHQASADIEMFAQPHSVYLPPRYALRTLSSVLRRGLRLYMQDREGEERYGGDKIILLCSRRHSPRGDRVVEDEDALVRALRILVAELNVRAKQQYRVVVHTGLESIYEQGLMFHHAALVISPHGAALSNVVFCNVGTVVLELPLRYKAHQYFVHLSTALGHKHYVLRESEIQFYGSFNVANSLGGTYDVILQFVRSAVTT